LEFARNSTFAGEKKEESRRFFSLPQTEQYQNEEGSAKTQAQERKVKGHHGKTKREGQSAKDITEKIKHKQAREIVFLSLPHSTRKIQANFLSKLLHFS